MLTPNQIREMIKSGQPLDGITFKGNLVLSGLSLDILSITGATIEGLLRIVNSTIKQTLDLRDSQVKGLIVEECKVGSLNVPRLTAPQGIATPNTTLSGFTYQ